MTDLHAFLHIWADGAWQQPVEDFLNSLAITYLGENLTSAQIGLVGTPENRMIVKAALPEWTVAAEADTGFTQVTLTALREFALAGNDGYVLYAHNKGAMNNTEFNTRWRRSMFYYVIEDWRYVIELLNDHDAAGCHWITPELFPTMTDADGRRFFGGEVYWARLDYIRTLPPLCYDTRWHSEAWIAENPAMRHFDLLSGWPAEDLFQVAQRPSR